MSRTWHRKRLERLTRSKGFDYSCRSHGGCPYCYDSRMHKFRRAIPADEQDQLDFGYEYYLEGKNEQVGMD